MKNDFRRYLEIIFRLYLATILKIFVRFILKELRCELSSSSDIISGSEKGGILFSQIVVIFEMKMKNENQTKLQVPEFFHKHEEKRPFNNLTRKNTSRQGVFFS